MHATAGETFTSSSSSSSSACLSVLGWLFGVAWRACKEAVKPTAPPPRTLCLSCLPQHTHTYTEKGTGFFVRLFAGFRVVKWSLRLATEKPPFILWSIASAFGRGFFSASVPLVSQHDRVSCDRVVRTLRVRLCVRVCVCKIRVSSCETCTETRVWV